MVFQYIVGGAIAIATFFLGYALLQHSRKGKSGRGQVEFPKLRFVTEDGGDGSADVIIVGAGVVGSSLAYALAKVTPLSFYSFLWNYWNQPS